MSDAPAIAEVIATHFADLPGASRRDLDARLRSAIDNLADQLCVAVDGNFDFMVRSPVEDEALEKLAMLVNFVLDTARRGMTALRDHNAALAQLDQAKSVFFSNASHELRTPLTLLLGPMADALARGGALEGEPLAAAHRNAVRLLKLVNALLDFSRIEAGGMKATLQPVDLAALTADVASLFRTAVEAAGLRLVVDCPPQPQAVLVDPGMWEKIVANLLANAFKFTRSGGITVRLRQEDDGAILEVADTGIGIPPADLEHLFERFHRIDSAWSRTHEGSGIGLAMVHELAKLHGGRIEVDSRVGQGSQFRVLMPLVTASTSPMQAAASKVTTAVDEASAFVDELHSWSVESRSELLGAADRGRILVADDNSDMRAYLARVLEPHWQVQLCADGREALAAARETLPEIVVCDVMMPNMTGFELLRALRSEEATRGIPVILLSARADPDSVEGGFELGTDDYVVKPFSSRDLVARVRSRLELARLRARLLEQERAARAEAEAANRAKDRFMAMLGHELRNPLAPIATALQVMNLKGDAATRREREIIGRQLAHVTRLIDDLLDVARVGRGAVDLRLENTDLASIVAKAVEATAPLVESRRHTLAIELPANLYVHGDATRLCQVVMNLLTNAAKYTDPGGQIEIKGGREGGEMVLRVRDNGIGIDATALPSIFEPFMQVAQSSERAVGGLGLGLAIVKNLVQLHGGSIDAQSAGIGKGTLVEMRLPAADGGELAMPGPARNGLETTDRPRRVLVVDDNVDAANSLATGLALVGHEVAVAQDGAAGLRMAAEFRPDVAVLDLGLPGMDGYELARRIRGLPGANVHLIALSGYGEAGDIARGREAGFAQHLVKPVDLTTVTNLVERLGAT